MATMNKIPPKKPHFLKPINSGFKNGIKIPRAFFKYLDGHIQEHAILRSAGKKWRVKVNGRLLGVGWGKFAEEHDLQVQDCLVFRHEGNMEFEVTIFNSNRLEREYEQPLERVNEENEQVNTTGKSQLNIKSSHKAYLNEEAAKDMPLDRPHFNYTIKSYTLKTRLVQLPNPFARENGLMNRKCTITIRDEQRSWTFRLYTSGNHTSIQGEWREFCIANCLQEGDQMMFQIVANGENPMLRFCDLRANASVQPEGKRTNSDAKRVSLQGNHSGKDVKHKRSH